MAMTNITKTKIYKVNSRHTIYLPKDFVSDSTFPFRVGEKLTLRIDGEKIIIEKNKGGGTE
jgi:hypothetical protein